jgi:hypothetical protein
MMNTLSYVYHTIKGKVANTNAHCSQPSHALVTTFDGIITPEDVEGRNIYPY